MAEGLGKGAGLALLAVPMVEAFTFTEAKFQRTPYTPRWYLENPKKVGKSTFF
jgi:hypothetical protein